MVERLNEISGPMKAGATPHVVGQRVFGVLGALLFCLSCASLVNAGEIVRLRPMMEGEVKAKGITLTAPAKIDIEAVGVLSRHSDDLLVFSWILDAESRRPVWVMRTDESDRGNSRALRTVRASIELPKGRYEVYIYGSYARWGEVTVDGKWESGDLWGSIFGGDNAERVEQYLKECYISLSSESGTAQPSADAVTGELPNALFRSTRMGDSEHATFNFEVTKPLSVRIYALIEQPDGYGSPVDGGWIVNLSSRERIWELDRWGTERAGGGKKNRLFDGEVALQPGRYALTFVTDDSHSFESFNSAPPYDPFNWGITVLPGKQFPAGAFTEIKAQERGTPIIDFTRARNDEEFEQAFRLSSATRLHVIALGEYDDGSDAFVDHGWIQRASSGESVFEMTFENTDHAGGAEKNRMFDGELLLAPGDYVASYVTDGSHAYRDWNAGAPYDARNWGMVVYPAEGVSSASVTPIAVTEVSNGSDVLVSIVRVRDDEHRQGEFTLPSQGKVRIYALGEGIDNEMADYGWIEERRTGRVVWEMTMRNTRAAGGASKNRLYDDLVLLEAGDYVVYYMTDGSHSYNDWNSTPPRDKRNWGITISRAEK